MCRLHLSNQKIAELLDAVNGLEDIQLQLKSNNKILYDRTSELTQDLSNKDAMIIQYLADKEIQKKENEDFVTHISELEHIIEELKKTIEIKDEQIAIANNKYEALLIVNLLSSKFTLINL